MKKKQLFKKLALTKETVSNLDNLKGGTEEPTKNPTLQVVSGDPCIMQSGCNCSLETVCIWSCIDVCD
jgi:hypothetical protein